MRKQETIHTDACGLDPYDQTYGLGYQVGHQDWSPFPRVNRLRQTFLDRKFYIDIERFRHVTEAYQKYEHVPAVLRCAKAFEHILMNATLYVYDDDLILGELAAPAKASPQYPEFSVNWMLHEALYEPFEEREHDRFYFVNEEDRQEFIRLCRWWQGKAVDDEVNAYLDEDQLKGSQSGRKIFQTNLYHYGGVGHYVMNYEKILRIGFRGMVEEAKQGMECLSKKDPDYGEKKLFYQSVILCHEAAIRYIERYARLAEEKAAACTDPQRRKELAEMATNCHQVAGGPARTFWQALQLFNFATTLTQIESNGHSISYGRMDQWLYPYYEADRKAGRLTRAFAQELLEVTYVKMNNPTKIRDGGTAKVRQGRGFGGECLTIGGVDENGRDVTNDLTMMLLDASVHTRMMCPWLLVRMHENTPYELKVKTAECIRAGYGHPNTGAELLQVVRDNWEGHDILYALVNSSKVHHFGNDDDYADALFRFMFDCYCRHLSGRATIRGGSFTPGVYSVSANVGMGLNTNASLDGRKAGEAISDNMGPVHTARGSHDIRGPIAVAHSVSKVDHSLATNGTLLNMKFPQDALRGSQGRQNLVSFIDTYLSGGPMHIQFNIMSSETMRAAQKHPEQYRDMLVRVAGYSAYFVELGKALQEDLINRTELHF